jgi:Ca2+-binding RTX toxin-like protein
MTGALTAEATATLLSITAGSGSDTLTVDATFASIEVDAGAGNDTVDVGGAITGTISGGDGTDTLSVTAAVDISAATITSFELLDINTYDVSVDESLVNGQSLVIQSTGGAATITLLNITASTDLSGLSFADAFVTMDIDFANNRDSSLGAAADVAVTGSSAADVIVGGTGNDTLLGGAGADTITGGSGADILDGGAGTADVLDYADVTVAISHSLTNISGMAINLSAAAITQSTIATAMGGTVVIGGGAGVAGDALAAGSVGYMATTAANSTATMVRDTVSNFENVIGSALNDYIVGSASANTITGGLGADIMTGGAGADAFTAIAGQSVVLTAETVTEDGILVTETITFANGLDVITDFTAGTGGDTIDTLAGAITSIAVDHTLDTSAVTYFLSGNFVAATGVFTITADGAGADTLVFNGKNSAFSTIDSFTLLSGVDSDDLVAANFV